MYRRWFRFSGKFNIESLSENLKKFKFNINDESSQGFIVEILRDKYIKCKFVEKIVLSRELEFPDQEPIIENYTKLQIIDFFIEENYLRVDTPSKSYLSLFNYIALATNFSYSISKIDICLNKFILSIGEYFDKHEIIYADINEVRLSKNVNARIAIQGEKDLNGILKRILNHNGAKIVSFKLVLFNRSESIKLSISNNTRIKCLQGDLESIENRLFSVFKECKK